MATYCGVVGLFVTCCGQAAQWSDSSPEAFVRAQPRGLEVSTKQGAIQFLCPSRALRSSSVGRDGVLLARTDALDLALAGLGDAGDGYAMPAGKDEAAAPGGVLPELARRVRRRKWSVLNLIAAVALAATVIWRL
ncbi:hypothetical protein FQZ97_394060 [compost metagenome]